jgi:cytochrome P450
MSVTNSRSCFPKPDVFDITRKVVPESIYFGFGIHRWRGFHLARLELRIVFQALLEIRG